MFKKLSCVIIVIIFCIICCFVFAGCSKYNAKIDSFAKQYISEDFLKENKVYGAWFMDGDYKTGDEVTPDGYYDKTSPKTRTFIINEKEEFDEIFTKYDEEINFAKKMVILYIFSDCSPRKYNLKKVDLKEQVLTVQYKLEVFPLFAGDTVMPYQRCIMITLDKIDISSAEFIEQ